MFILTFCVCLNVGAVCAQITIHVTPTANPQITWADFNVNPDILVTLPQALAILKNPALRDVKGKLKDGVTVHLDTGIYRMSQTLNIDAASSGCLEHPVIIEGPKDASAIISGGRPVNGFTPVTDHAMLARLPVSARNHVMQANLPSQGITDYGQYNRRGFGRNGIVAALEVFYLHQPMQLARWPNKGFARIATTPDGSTGRTFTVKGANVSAWKVENNPLATGYWFYPWADETSHIEKIDLRTGQLTLPLPSPIYGLKSGQPIFFQNLLAELDQPGEWYLDNEEGILYFWPPGPLSENDVEVSLLEKLLVIDGANYQRINGLTFENARGDAITVNGGQHVSIANSIIRNIGSRAAVIRGENSGLIDTLIENTGEAGIAIAGGDRQTLKPSNLYVERSTIRNFARLTRTYQPAIWVAGVGNRIIGNRIFDAPHAAIIFFGNDHLISRNEIFDVCKETGDAGAIYTGRDWTARGTVISNNHIHDIAPNTTKGVYLDDQASGITIRGNLFERLAEAVFIGGGRDNLIEGNKFVDTATAIHLDARGKATKGEMHRILLKRLTEVPYSETPYKERYPNLANILEDEPGEPKYNVARWNLLIGKTANHIDKKAESGIRIDSFAVSRNW